MRVIVIWCQMPKEGEGSEFDASGVLRISAQCKKIPKLESVYFYFRCLKENFLAIVTVGIDLRARPSVCEFSQFSLRGFEIEFAAITKAASSGYTGAGPIRACYGAGCANHRGHASHSSTLQKYLRE